MSQSGSPAGSEGAGVGTSASRPGFTLVELLVVIAIVGLLVGLLLPAVQAAREAARRTSCQNNVRQLGLAMHLHMDTARMLPANGNYAWNGTGLTTSNAWSALARILPFIEQESLFRGINFAQSYSLQPGISSQRVATFMCASEQNDRGHGTDATYGHKYWPLNYAVNMGTWQILTRKSAGMQTGDGAFVPNRGRRHGEFTDGLSKTLAFAEVRAFTARMIGTSTSATFANGLAVPTDVAALPLGAFSATTFTHVEWVDGKVHETGFTTAFPPNATVRHADTGDDRNVDIVLATEPNPGDTYAAVTARSFHSGGVNTLMMDASVRFVEQSIGLDAWRALGTAAGGEAATDP